MVNRKVLAEVIGTFILVFCGTGAIVIDQQSPGAIGHLGICMTFGLVVLAMVYTFGETSGAHLNPAVTIGFWVASRMPTKQVVPYILAQFTGALLASLALKLLFSENEGLGGTNPAGAHLQSFVLEFLLSYFLMLVIINVSQGSKEVGVLAGIAVGATVGFEALFAGPICGASMNPARSLAPALVSGNLSAVYIYLLAPVIGMVLATLTWKAMNSPKPGVN
jgi:aquaporin NIP